MIGKTRQDSSEDSGQGREAPLGKSRGVLGWPSEEVQLAVSRRLPRPELADCVAYYWTVSWDLRGQPPHQQETLPHPNTYLVLEDGKLTISGVSTVKFTRLLAGRSRVFGVKFEPGGLRPFVQGPVSLLTDQISPAKTIFGDDADLLESKLLSCATEDELVAAANAFFQPQIPLPDDSIALATRLVERILKEPEIRTVDDLVARSGIGKRSLQRLFNEYVGVPPKWVIRRYRLHELVERLNSGVDLNWAEIALDLGYFDQAHLINDFREIVGYSPVRYQVATGSYRP